MKNKSKANQNDQFAGPNEDPTCLAFFVNGEEVARVDISLKTVEKIKKFARTNGQTLESFGLSALKKLVNSLVSEPRKALASANPQPQT